MDRASVKGFSLVELMVGLTVGLFVLAGVGAVYVSTMRGSAETLAANRLNQEIRAIVDIMSLDIRRAGFGYPNDASIRVFDDGACIVYLYDLNGLPHHTGFRLNKGRIQMKAGGTLADCTSGTWEGITDSSMVTVTNLNFNAGNSVCFDRISSGKIACGGLTSDVEVRRIDISVGAKLTSDSAVALQADESIRVRNDLLLRQGT